MPHASRPAPTLLGDGPAAFWNERFGSDFYLYGKEPNAFLASQLPGLVPVPSRVLCIGDGEGRNGVWCARQGWETTSLEPSSSGCTKIRALAGEQGVSVEVIHDLFPSSRVAPGAFDAVVLCFVHMRSADRPAFHRAVLDVLRPGGVVLLEAFTPAQRRNGRTSGGPQDLDLLFTAEALADDFRDAEVLSLTEETVELREGPGHHGPGDVVRLLARRRASR